MLILSFEYFNLMRFLTVIEDPYIADECDPSLCKAIDSSLWEIKVNICEEIFTHRIYISENGNKGLCNFQSLQNHWHPQVSKKALFINKQLPQMEWDLSDVLEIRHKDVCLRIFSLQVIIVIINEKFIDHC